MKIRVAVPDDLEQLLVLFKGYLEFYQMDFKERDCADFLKERLAKSDSVIIVAENLTPTGLTGFAQLYPSFSSLRQKKSWILNDLFVAPTWRGQGIGQVLVKFIQQYSLESQAKGISLQTGKENKEAQRLYEMNGWKRDENYFTYHFTH
ncbi:MAG TPA: GNAT family N-acetyltransferase [Bacteriovoracaceae bacterium]|nr:GNAT family N-acetyltransferase [Bacteriovoracaceae bacterium]